MFGLTSPQPFVLFLIWLGLEIPGCRSQWAQTVSYTPYDPLPTSPLTAISDGTFQWPLTEGTQKFLAGTVMRIKWQTTLAFVNIWAVHNLTWGESMNLIFDTDLTSLDWTIDCGEFCNVPWVLRATDSRASNESQQREGFFSSQFWIEEAVKSSTVSSTSISSSTLAASMPSTPEPTGSNPVPIPSPTPTSIPIQADETNGSNNTVAIGAGVGVGVGILLLAAMGFFVWRHYRRKGHSARTAEQEIQVARASMMTKSDGGMSPMPGSLASYQSPAKWPQESQGAFEAPVIRDPHELDAGFVDRR